MTKSNQYYIRKTHRYLGLVLGIQFLAWTVSGLYFSRSDLDEIHGDFERKHPPHLTTTTLASPSKTLQQAGMRVDSLQSIQLVSILGKPHYYIQFFSGNQSKKLLAEATTGSIRPPVSKEEAVRIAAESFNGIPRLKAIAYITGTGNHHEYRKKPLPAWAVSFDHPSQTTVYVSANSGKVESFRNDKWRLFDFLWMGHTMDYKGRDDFNNLLLRIFSAFGLVTILSGFVLFWVSSRTRRRLLNGKRQDHRQVKQHP